jgi:hypothetical protein
MLEKIVLRKTSRGWETRVVRAKGMCWSLCSTYEGSLPYIAFVLKHGRGEA